MAMHLYCDVPALPIMLCRRLAVGQKEAAQDAMVRPEPSLSCLEGRHDWIGTREQICCVVCAWGTWDFRSDRSQWPRRHLGHLARVRLAQTHQAAHRAIWAGLECKVARHSMSLPLSLRKVMPPVSPCAAIVDEKMMTHTDSAVDSAKEKAVRDGVAAKGIQGSHFPAAQDCSVMGPKRGRGQPP
jgi:hypothetical protein